MPLRLRCGVLLCKGKDCDEEPWAMLSCEILEDGTFAFRVTRDSDKEHVLRMTGIGGSIGTLAGTLLSYVLVTDSCVLEILANGSAV